MTDTSALPANFKYEVAFSFLAQDEEVATKLNELIADRVSTFLYSNRQEELAAQDGEKRFNAVFGQEARIVVVLYRPSWGETRWTRIEQTAIQNRGYEEGYEFLVLIPLDSPATTPKWVPRTYIYVGLERWGLEGAAAVIESRVTAAGGAIRPETAEDHARRLSRKQQLQAERTRFLESEKAVSAADEQFDSLLDELEQSTQRIEGGSALPIKCKRWGGEIEIHCGNYCMAVAWHRPYSNTLANSKITAELYRGFPRRPGRMIFDEGRRLQNHKFHFDLDESRVPCWRDSTNPASMEVKSLADQILRILLSRVEADGDRK